MLDLLLLDRMVVLPDAVLPDGIPAGEDKVWVGEERIGEGVERNRAISRNLRCGEGRNSAGKKKRQACACLYL